MNSERARQEMAAVPQPGVRGGERAGGGAGRALRYATLALIAFFGAAVAVPAAYAQIAFRSASSASASATGTVYVSSVGTAASATSGNVTPALPLGMNPNDLLLAVVESRDNVPATLPSGWTLLNQGSGASGLHQATIYWKRAGPGETAPTVTHPGGGRIIAQILSIGGADMAEPFDAANSFTASPLDLTTEAGAITTVSNSLLVFTSQIGAISESAGSVSGSSPWTLMGSPSSGVTGDGVSIVTYAGNRPTPGAQAALTLTRTHDSAESHGAQIALRAGTTQLASKPAGTVANDVLVAMLAFDGGSAVVTAPSGWTLVRRLETEHSALAVYVKTAGSSEPSQYVWSIGPTSGATLAIQAFSGVDPVNPIDVENGQNTASGLAHATPSITTTLANAMLVSAHAYRSSGSWSPPAGMTEAADIASLTAPDQFGVSLLASYAPQAAAGASGAKTATASNDPDAGHAHLLALRPAATSAQAQLYYIHADHLNTPRVIANQAGQTVWSWANDDPFGGNAPNENPSGLGTFTCNLRLPGQYFDKETNLHYNNFRDYDPSVGRYVQSDPIGLLGGINTYAYVGGNPLSYADFLGLRCTYVGWISGGPEQSEAVREKYEQRLGDWASPNNAKVNCKPEGFFPPLGNKWPSGLLPPCLPEVNTNWGRYRITEITYYKIFEPGWHHYLCDIDPNACTKMQESVFVPGKRNQRSTTPESTSRMVVRPEGSVLDSVTLPK